MEQVTMSRKERERLVIFNQIKLKQMDRRGAAELLGVSLRQLQRLYPRWIREGDGGLIHRSRGKRSPRHWDTADRDRALSLVRESYRGFGPTLLSEKLGQLHGIWASHDTIRRWLLEAGLLEKTRRGRRSRCRRQRKRRFGEMVQMDGSPHAWLEDRSGPFVLMTVIDDATGRRRGRFFPAETMEAAMQAFGMWCQRFGVPVSLYVDRHGIYRADRDPTAEELRSGKRPVTQFGRAMKEMDVELILARSPQAKGRVERSNGLLQDRLVKELRLAGVKSLEEANRWLEASHYWDTLDEKFAVEAAEETDAHRPLVVRLEDVMCIKEKRSVGLDGCVQWSGRVLQMEDSTRLKRVEVWERLDGSVELLGDGRRLHYREISLATRRLNQKAAAKLKRGPIRNNKVHKPTKRQQITLRPASASRTTEPALRRVG
jgi:transposase